MMRRMYNFSGRDYDAEKRQEKEERRSRFTGRKPEKNTGEPIDIEYEEID